VVELGGKLGSSRSRSRSASAARLGTFRDMRLKVCFLPLAGSVGEADQRTDTWRDPAGYRRAAVIPPTRRPAAARVVLPPCRSTAWRARLRAAGRARGPHRLWVMHGPGQRVGLLGAAVATIAGMALLTGCGAGWRQPAPGPPPSTSPSAIGAAAQASLLRPGGFLHWAGCLDADPAAGPGAAGQGIPGGRLQLPHRVPLAHALVVRRRRQRSVPHRATSQGPGRAAASRWFRDAKVFSVGLPK
jgi:hypothetical protein